MTTITHVLLERGVRSADLVAYRFLEDSGAVAQEFTYGRLLRQALDVAALLADRRASRPEGQTRALLLYPPGPDYLLSFLGCMLAGVIAVPAYPPDPSRLNRSLPRLEAIAADAEVDVILTTEAIRSMADAFVAQSPALARGQWIATDQAEHSGAWQPPETRPDAVAFLQYTSGSTSAPRGVILTHANLTFNLERISEAFGISEESVGVSWLPPYHDMGLIGGILAPMFRGRPTDLLSPLAFLRDPLVWLRAITKVRATISGGPNFAYEHCVRRSTPADVAALDLSCWEVAFNGAEPVRPDTLRRFAERFGPAGFRSQSFLPCYGLAEATLMVSTAARGAGARTIACDAQSLERGIAVVGEGRELTSCGRSVAGQDIAVVDPVSRRRRAPGEVGEILVRGPSVAGGYFGNREGTRDVFAATVADESEPYLRTGDLGFAIDGELYVTGRTKDLIIVRGRNIAPHDIEDTVERSHRSIRRGCIAAFAIERGGEESVGIVFEVDRKLEQAVEPGDVLLVELAATAAASVTREHDVSVGLVVAIRSGSLPKTSSGKVQRNEARRSALAADGTDELARWPPVDQRPLASSHSASAAPLDGTVLRLRQVVATVLGAQESSVDVHAPLSRLGLDSLAGMTLLCEIDRAFGVSLPPGVLYEAGSLDGLASLLDARAPERAVDTTVEATAPRSASRAVGMEELALLLYQELHADSPAYNVAFVLRSGAPVASNEVAEWFGRLAERHPALRTYFTKDERGEFRAHVSDAAPRIDTMGPVAPDALADTLRAEAERPFRLDSPPLRIVLLSVSDGSVAVGLFAHQIAVDYWSLAVLLSELETILEGRALPVAPATMAERVEAEHRYLHSEDAIRDAEGWRAALRDRPVLDLPSSSSEENAGRASIHGPPLSVEVCNGVRAIAAACQVTPFVVWLAAYAAALAAIGGTRAVVIGTPYASRTSARFARTVGQFANPLPIPVSVEKDASIRELVRATAEAVSGAVARGRLPFLKIGEALRASGSGHAPTFRATLIVDAQQPSEAPSRLLAAAGARAGTEVRIGERTWSTLHLPIGVTTHDLTLRVTQSEGDPLAELSGSTALDRDVATSILTVMARLLASDLDARVDAVVGDAFAEHAARVVAPIRDVLGPVEALERYATSTPDAIAVLDGDVPWTFARLRSRASGLRRSLAESGVRSGDVVAVTLDRGATFCAAVLAIWSLRAAYVPIDRSLPARRRSELYGRARVRAVVGHGVDVETAGGARCIDPSEVADEGGPLPAPQPADVAYVLFTSGSTGMPKGALVSHAGLVNHIGSKFDVLALTDADVVVQNAPLSFDVSVWQYFAALCAGGTIAVPPEAAVLDPAALYRYCAGCSATVLEMVPSMISALLQWRGVAKPERLSKLRWLIATGEALPPPLAAQLVEELEGVRILNAYGPAECSDDVTHFEVTGGAPMLRVPIGSAIRHTSVRVVDEDSRARPIGAWGEIAIGGLAVGYGYLDEPRLTADAFRPDPFGPPGSRLYRTGDVGRLRGDGTVEFQGRVDHQVKLRGRRIELGEIEAVAAAAPGVLECAVTLEGTSADARLVLHLAAEADPAVIQRDVEAFLGERLPRYMVPSRVCVSRALPKNRNGKIDRAALRSPSHPAPRVPRGDSISTTRAVCEAIWAEVLELRDVPSDVGFFDLGGHSLAAMRVQARLRATLGIDVSVGELFDDATLDRFVEVVERAQGRPVEAISKRPSGAEAPLTREQERLWFLCRLDPTSPFYNVAWTVRTHDELDVAALRSALESLASRHETLRTTIRERDTGPIQHVSEAQTISLSEQVAPSEDLALHACVEHAHRVFDLGKGPLWQVLVVRLPHGALLQVSMHHMIADAWSGAIILEELAALYAAARQARPVSLPAIPFQYGDYAVWQRRRVASEPDSSWTRALRGCPATSTLPPDRPRPSLQSHEGAMVFVDIPADTAARLRRVAARASATPFMVLAGALAYVVGQYSAQDDVVLGTTVAGRASPGTERVVGFFVNTIPLRFDLGGDPSGRELILRARSTATHAYSHQEVPFADIVASAGVERALSHNPLFQILIDFVDVELAAVSAGGSSFEHVELEERVAKFDLALAVRPAGGGFRVGAEYATHLYDRTTIERFLHHWAIIVDRIVTAEEELVSEAWPPTTTARRVAREPSTIADMWKRSVDRFASSPALEVLGRSMSYAELDQVVRRFSSALDQRTRRGDRVALVLRPGLSLMAALLACGLTGRVAMPLDARAAAPQLAALLRVGRPTLVVSDGSVPDGEWSTVSSAQMSEVERGQDVAAPSPGEIAYVIFTSGSTGTPRPVAVSHGSLAAYVEAAAADYGYRPGDRVLSFSPHHFDASIDELYPVWRGGGTVVVARDTIAQSVEDFLAETHLLGITVYSLPTSFVHELAFLLERAKRAPPPSVRMLLFGGEPADPARMRSLVRAGHRWRIVNAYGPTEATVAATRMDLAGGIERPTVPIGMPFEHVDVQVVNKSLVGVPDGMPGELLLGGPSIAMGYLGDAAATAERFVPDPRGNGGRVYRTGDWVRRLPDGALEFLGRRDQQVKVRGHRLELGEVERTIAGLAGVREVACVAVARPDGTRITAFVCVDDRSIDALREDLRRVAPAYAIPETFSKLEQLPVGPNGKIDRAELRRRANELRNDPATMTAQQPRTRAEEALAEVWAEVLGRKSLGREANFFDLGGDSLRALRVVSVAASKGIVFTPRDLFERPTLADLATVVTFGSSGGDDAPPPSWGLPLDGGQATTMTFVGAVAESLRLRLLDTGLAEASGRGAPWSETEPYPLSFSTTSTGLRLDLSYAHFDPTSAALLLDLLGGGSGEDVRHAISTFLEWRQRVARRFGPRAGSARRAAARQVERLEWTIVSPVSDGLRVLAACSRALGAWCDRTGIETLAIEVPLRQGPEAYELDLDGSFGRLAAAITVPSSLPLDQAELEKLASWRHDAAGSVPDQGSRAAGAHLSVDDLREPLRDAVEVRWGAAPVPAGGVQVRVLLAPGTLHVHLAHEGHDAQSVAALRREIDAALSFGEGGSA